MQIRQIRFIRDLARVRINPSILVDVSEFHFDFETRGAKNADAREGGGRRRRSKILDSFENARRIFDGTIFELIFRVCQRVITRLYYVFITPLCVPRSYLVRDLYARRFISTR